MHPELTEEMKSVQNWVQCNHKPFTDNQISKELGFEASVYLSILWVSGIVRVIGRENDNMVFVYKRHARNPQKKSKYTAQTNTINDAKQRYTTQRNQMRQYFEIL